MSVGELLRAHLVANAGVSTRVYPVRIPQNPTYPAISYTRASSTPTNGTSDRREPRWQIDCWATTYAGVQAVAATVKNIMEEWHQVGAIGVAWARVVNELDDFDDEPGREGVYRVSIDVVLHTTGD